MARIIAMSWESVEWALRFARVKDASARRTEAAALKLVLIALASDADAHGQKCWPSMARLAARTELDEKTVRRAIAVLEARKLIEIVRGGGPHGTNLYRLNQGDLGYGRSAPGRESGTPGRQSETPPHSAPRSGSDPRSIRRGELRSSYGPPYQPVRTSKRDQAAATNRPIGCTHQPRCADDMVHTTRMLREVRRLA